MEQFLKRVLGEKSRFFTITLADDTKGRYYRLRSENGKIQILADSKPDAALGLYRYLKEFWHVNYSWCGNCRMELKGKEPVLLTTEIFQPVKQKYISMFNYCTYGYSMAYWSWERWEKELDFLLLNGVNLPVFAVGLEAVWYRTLLKNRFTKEEALSFLSSPSHFPWQLMSNIEGVMPVMSEELVNRRLALGQSIMARMLELGMTPVQMGFSGFLPGQFREKYPHAVVQKQDWFGHKGTCQLDPQNPFFKKIGIDFLNIQKELFGTHHFYACDPFHESEPPVEGQEYLKNVSHVIQDMLHEFDPDYRWVMQSWSIREGIVTAIPKERLLILDLAGEKHAETEYFWGYDFITGNLHNFGGRINLHGDIGLLAQNQYARMSAHPNAVGTGLFMEGIDQNPLYYDLAFQMLTCNKKISLDEWLKDYCRRRYGSDNLVLQKGLELLAASAYKAGTNGVEKSSMICARPALEVKKSGPNEGFEIPYETEDLKCALWYYLNAFSPGLKDGYYFDIYDLARQTASNELQEISKKICRAYEGKSWENFRTLCDNFLNLLLLVDQLLLTRKEFNLYAVLNLAQNYTDDPEVNHKLVTAHRALLTTWSDARPPVIFDYSWREWGGMIQSFYYVRWNMFFSFLREEFFKKDRYCLEKERQLERRHGRESFYANDFYRKLAAFEESWINGKYETMPCAQNNEETFRIARLLVMN